MDVDRFERIWMWAATGMLGLFTSAIVVTALGGSTHPPSHTETVDPETLTIGGEFSAPGVTRDTDGGIKVTMRAELYVFRPSVVRVPSGVPVLFRITSPDVLHGFQIVGTNVNVTVAPGYVSQTAVTFDTPGEYLVVCNEYCGLGHHLMQGTVIVEPGP